MIPGKALLETKNSLKSGVSSRTWLQQPQRWFSATLCVSKRASFIAAIIKPQFQSVQTQYAPRELFVGPTVSNQCGPNAIFPASFTSPQQPQFYAQPQSTPQTSLQPQSTPQTPFPFLSPKVSQQPLQTNQPPHQLNIPCFPSPGEGQFIVYLLQYCPTQTIACFGLEIH